jgi:polysaccharide export outer membrane protein
MKKYMFALIFAVAILSAYGQDNGPAPAGLSLPLFPELGQGYRMPALGNSELAANTQLARSNPNYPVTPGDIYALVYTFSNALISHDLLVANDFSLTLNVFGRIDTRGMTLAELSDKVQQIITGAYPDSTPLLFLKSIGTFRVFMKGEVKAPAYYPCWGLTRLSDIFSGAATPFSSLRDIEIIGTGGAARTCDLFAALRFGAEEENPLLKPGDTVSVKKEQKRVSLLGQVKRPGRYQLLKGEGLDELILRYGDGFTPLADPGRTRIVRYESAQGEKSETIYLDAQAQPLPEIELRTFDEVYVPDKRETLPVLYLEGAIAPNLKSAGAIPQIANRYNHQFAEGELLSTALLKLSALFTPVSDLRSAYISRRGESQPIPLDLEALLFAYRPQDDLLLQPYDRLVIPFKQYFVQVTGAVYRPGSYPYVPNRTYHYYINQAGGFILEKCNGKRVAVLDRYENARESDLFIQPEDRIFVPSNNALYNFNRYFPVIVTVSALILTVFQIMDLAGGSE